MGYVRITIYLWDSGKRSGVRAFSDPMNLEDIRQHAWVLSCEILGREAIQDVVVNELPTDDPAVVSLILRDRRRKKAVPRSDGEHPFAKRMQRRPPR